MPEKIGGYTTVDGETYLKKRDSAGRTYHVREGDGRVSESAYNGGQSRFDYAVTSDDGKVLESLRDAMSVDELREKTGIPFDRRDTPGMIPEDLLSDTEERRLNELSRFNGFYEELVENGEVDRTESGRLEAAKEYLEFRARLEEADNEAVRASIRQEYMKSGY